MSFVEVIYQSFYTTLIENNRWQFYVEGLKNTLIMTGLASITGILIGLVLAVFKVSRAELGPHKPKTISGQTGRLLVRFAGWFADAYTTVIRGTPVLLQLLIVYYIVFKTAPTAYGVYIAALAFGINSGAYVCEIIRAGIQSVDRGQTEAGRSLGLGGLATMRLIVLPQAVKNILPTIFNELISLLKETSVAGYITLVDVTRAGEIIRSRLWSMPPLIVSALIYLTLVLGLTQVQKHLERRFGASDRRL